MLAPFDRSWRLGTIGFAYADWTGGLYPSGVTGPDRLSYYAQWFDAVEVDATFHAVPAPKVVRRWGEAVPEGFQFCLKTPRAISHGAAAGHLVAGETRDSMLHFLDVGSELGDKLAVVLVQFPGVFAVDRHNELRGFLEALPKGFRYAVELRHDSWWIPRTAELFRDLGVCWVAGDEVRKHEASAPPSGYRPRGIVPTTEFLYVRWIGWHEQFPDLSREYLDPTARLAWWKTRLESVLSKREELAGVYGFFGNGYSGYAPATCQRFYSEVGIETKEFQGTPLDQPEVSLFDHSDEG